MTTRTAKQSKNRPTQKQRRALDRRNRAQAHKDDTIVAQDHGRQVAHRPINVSGAIPAAVSVIRITAASAGSAVTAVRDAATSAINSTIANVGTTATTACDAATSAVNTGLKSFDDAPYIAMNGFDHIFAAFDSINNNVRDGVEFAVASVATATAARDAATSAVSTGLKSFDDALYTAINGFVAAIRVTNVSILAPITRPAPVSQSTDLNVSASDNTKQESTVALDANNNYRLRYEALSFDYSALNYRLRCEALSFDYSALSRVAIGNALVITSCSRGLYPELSFPWPCKVELSYNFQDVPGIGTRWNTLSRNRILARDADSFLQIASMLRLSKFTVRPALLSDDTVQYDSDAALATDVTDTATAPAVEKISTLTAIYRTVRQAITTLFESLCHLVQARFRGVVSMARATGNAVKGFSMLLANWIKAGFRGVLNMGRATGNAVKDFSVLLANWIKAGFEWLRSTGNATWDRCFTASAAAAPVPTSALAGVAAKCAAVNTIITTITVASFAVIAISAAAVATQEVPSAAYM